MFSIEKFPLDYDGIKSITECVNKFLEKCKIPKNDKAKATLIIDEATDSLIKHDKKILKL